ncbi:hypothetical protein EV121DRAFT_295463 [Schizophyllum commune]
MDGGDAVGRAPRRRAGPPRCRLHHPSAPVEYTFFNSLISAFLVEDVDYHRDVLIAQSAPQDAARAAVRRLPSQALVTFLLDGLYEDLYRVLKAPYVEEPWMTAATSSSRSWRGSRGMGMSMCRRHLVALDGPSTSTTADTTTSWNIDVGWRVRHRCRPRPQASPEGAALVLGDCLPSSSMLLFIQVGYLSMFLSS